MFVCVQLYVWMYIVNPHPIPTYAQLSLLCSWNLVPLDFKTDTTQSEANVRCCTHKLPARLCVKWSSLWCQSLMRLLPWYVQDFEHVTDSSVVWGFLLWQMSVGPYLPLFASFPASFSWCSSQAFASENSLISGLTPMMRSWEQNQTPKTRLWFVTHW